MANREDLLIIRAARAGKADAQLRLGKRYLFGGDGLPKSLPTALYWLDRAAQQNEEDAWLLIGRHVPFETVEQAAQPAKLAIWYERAFDAGVVQAGFVLARLVLGQAEGAVSPAMRAKALRALHAAAHAGIAEAQWLLARPEGGRKEAGIADVPQASLPHIADDTEAMREWAARAARSGVRNAQYALAEHAWARNDTAVFLRWALPLARRLLDAEPMDDAGIRARDASLALRCAYVLQTAGEGSPDESGRLLEYAAEAGDPNAQFFFGLWLAHIDESGRRTAANPAPANYKRAIRWLSLAAGQGVPAAWFALSKIYLKAECSRRDPVEARRCLEIAAEAGHGAAQYELGAALWRERGAQRKDASNDVRAARLLRQAWKHGNAEAGLLLGKVCPRAVPAAWAREALRHMPREAWRTNPLLAARLELAAAFGLSRTEALLIDPKAADMGDCLVVDVQALHPHSKRRLVSVESAAERQLLNRIVGIFEGVDCGPDGPEGNYRQRLYRLKTLA